MPVRFFHFCIVLPLLILIGACVGPGCVSIDKRQQFIVEKGATLSPTLHLPPIDGAVAANSSGASATNSQPGSRVEANNMLGLVVFKGENASDTQSEVENAIKGSLSAALSQGSASVSNSDTGSPTTGNDGEPNQ